jgi:hypothetical protein
MLGHPDDLFGSIYQTAVYTYDVRFHVLFRTAGFVLLTRTIRSPQPGGEGLQIGLIDNLIHDQVRTWIEIRIAKMSAEGRCQDGQITAVDVTIPVNIGVPKGMSVNFTSNRPDSRLSVIFEKCT